jgi:aspartyl aminopeptidase
MASKLPKASQQHITLAEKAAAFLTKSTDPFHAVHNVVQRLKEAGFIGLSAASPLTGKIQAGGKYYYTVESSTLVAFTVGPKFAGAGQPFGFHMIGGHTDSPNLKIKPRSKKHASGCTMLGVECYGGGLWHTWFDRDLGVSGRVLIRRSDGGGDGDGAIQQRLVQLDDPIARISTLCIHLQSAEERTGFAVNKENHTAPIIATDKIVSDANEQAKVVLEEGAEAQVNTTTGTDAWKEGHEPLLLQAIAEKLQVPVEDIVDFELSLFDTQAAALGGITKEFLYSARLDNLATVFCATEALCHQATNNDDDNDDAADNADVSVMVAFDHEEVGSTSAQGAGSPVMQDAVQRISSALNGGNISPDLYNACIRNSFILSIDQAHAIHPNYSSKHEAAHAPQLNAGVVIKTNSNQRYATNGITAFVVRELGRLAGIPIQEFVVRNDCSCGSTIGPTVSALTGIRTVDAGMPQLSMHSCREVMGIVDCKYWSTILLVGLIMHAVHNETDQGRDFVLLLCILG